MAETFMHVCILSFCIYHPSSTAPFSLSLLLSLPLPSCFLPFLPSIPSFLSLLSSPSLPSIHSSTHQFFIQLSISFHSRTVSLRNSFRAMFIYLFIYLMIILILCNFLIEIYLKMIIFNIHRKQSSCSYSKNYVCMCVCVCV